MKRIACIGDYHGARARLEAVTGWLEGRQVDGVLMVGDFATVFPRSTPKFASETVGEPLRVVRRLGVPVLLVPGNHDLRLLELPENVDRRVGRICGLRVVGLGGSGPAKFGFPYEWSEEEIRALDLGEADILLTHTPPARTSLDRLAGSGAHAGSEAVRELSERFRVLVCGHIHEARGVESVGQCLACNVGSLGAPYGRTQVTILHLTDESVEFEQWLQGETDEWSCVQRQARDGESAEGEGRKGNG